MKDVYTFVISSWCDRFGDVRCDSAAYTDNSGFPSQWSSDLFHCVLFCLLYSFSERKFLIFMVNPQQAILFVIVFLVLQQIEGNLIYPHVVGESVGLPSIWVLAAVTIGGNLMGIVGMLVFIPLLSVLYTIFREFVYLRLKKQNIKQVTKTEIEEYTVEEIVNSDIPEGK